MPLEYGKRALLHKLLINRIYINMIQFQLIWTTIVHRLLLYFVQHQCIIPHTQIKEIQIDNFFRIQEIGKAMFTTSVKTV